MDEGVEPLVARMGHGEWALAWAMPDAAHDRLEPDAMLIGAPDCHPSGRVGSLYLAHRLGQSPPLNAS